MNKEKNSNTIRAIARIGSIILISFALVFAIIMGANDLGDGVKGLIKNAPNMLPWLLPLGAIIWAWKNEKSGGIALTLIGIGLVYFFNFSGPNFWVATFALTMLFPIMGILFILSSYKRA